MRTDGQTERRTKRHDKANNLFVQSYGVSSCCVRSVTQTCIVYISIYIHTVMNTTLLQLVAIYNIQLHVSALYVGHHQVVQRTY